MSILRPSEDVAAIGAPEKEIEPPLKFQAAVVSIDEAIMELRATCAPPPGSALKIETPDALWLGETESCAPTGDSWLVRVRLRHVLRDFETLARLAERFGTAAPRGVSVRV